jgi:hypothetical protein
MLNNLSGFTMASTEVSSTPFTIPQDFIGFHFHRYPIDPFPVNGVYDTPPSPSFGYGAVRTHDNGRCQWRQLNPTNGTYNWTQMDEFMAAFADKTVTFTLYGTPTWAVSSADALVRGPYYNLGECGMPTNMTYVTTFLNALFTRYAGKIKNFEIWNEPGFAQNYTGFWWGSLQDLLLLSKTCYDWIKSHYPTVTVLSPGFSPGLYDKATETEAYTFCNTALTGGAKGHTYCDAIAFHPYKMFYTGTTNSKGWINTSVDTRPNSLDILLDLPGLLGISKPLYISEWGVDVGGNGNVITAYNTLSNAEQAVLTWRMMIYCALKQVKAFYIYSYDDGLSGNWCTTGGRTINKDLCNMVNEFHTKIAGKTINLVQRFHDGRVMVVMSTGETYCY